MKIEITGQTAKAILKLYNRYYFGLFEKIATEKEEYELRDALSQVVSEIISATFKR
jgi:hypothetical protein